MLSSTGTRRVSSGRSNCCYWVSNLVLPTIQRLALNEAQRTNHDLGIGAGESGKSTILKQMRLIYTKDGFNKNEKEEWRIIIFNNILDGLRMTVDAMDEYGIAFQYENTTVSTCNRLMRFLVSISMRLFAIPEADLL